MSEKEVDVLIEIRGARDRWHVSAKVHPDCIEDLRARGLEVIRRSGCYEYPVWVVDCGLTPLWALMQDIRNWWAK